MREDHVKLCIEDVLQQSSTEDVFRLYHILSEGAKEHFKQYKQEAKRLTSSVEQDRDKEILRNMMSNEGIIIRAEMVEAIPQLMQDVFQNSGTLFNQLFGDYTSYSAQLEACLDPITKGLIQQAAKKNNDEWKKAIEQIRKDYVEPQMATKEHALQQEEILISLVIDEYLNSLSIKEKDALLRELQAATGESIERLTKDTDHAGKLSLIIAGPLVAKALAPSIGKILLAKGLSGAALKGPLAFLGPIGWIVLGVLVVNEMIGLAAKRDYESYITAVIFLFVLRHTDHLMDLQLS